MYFRISFPSGLYYGAESHNPAIAEWPPHPTRLFSAMVASAYRSGNSLTPQKRDALEWLESLPSPEIHAPVADTPDAPVSFVPTGDFVGRKGKKGQEQYEHLIHRWRQARHFPSAIILNKPEVYYQWDQEPDESMFSALDDIAFGVTHVGTSHSMALIMLYPGKMPLSPNLKPDENGSIFLRGTSGGRLEELDAVFESSSGVRRPPSACEPLACYRQEAIFRKTQPHGEFLTLRISDTMHGADTAYYIGKALRRAVMSVMGDDAPEPVHGHNNKQHIGWLPLPDVGHKYSKGRIIGFGIMLPWDISTKERSEILAGIGNINKLRLPDGRISNICHMMPGEKKPVALSKETWTKPSKIWASVTPVVLDRPPKRLTEDRVCNALRQSLVFAGYPEPIKIQMSKYSFFNGAPPAFKVPVKTPRYHAVVEFETPISGPLIAGRLRYFGIGLFRPVVSSY